MSFTVDQPLRQISIRTSDGSTYTLDEHHYLTSLTETRTDGSAEFFETIVVDYQDLVPGARFIFEELVFDGSSKVHERAKILEVA
jgi:hypothetical protein